MSIIFLSASTNPDSASIARKDIINMPYSSFDVSASLQTEFIKTNYAENVQYVVVNSPGKKIAGSVYYTPLYTEKLDYSVWLTRINKNFEELN
jgi:hypothetical protein